jgi:hypothetical protein
MIPILLLLLQQPPSLEATTSADLEPGPCTLLAVSRTGKFLVIGRPDLLEIRTAADLMPLRFLKGPWTGFNFDEKDEHLLLVDGALVRIETKEWKEKSREPLEGIELLPPRSNLPPAGAATFVPRQAYVADDGSVYYRTKDGGVSRAVRREGKLVVEKLTSEIPGDDYKVEGIVGAMDTTPFLVLKYWMAGILEQQRPCSLAGSSGTLMGALCGDVAAFVGGPYEGLYELRTWRIKSIRHGKGSWDVTRNDAVADPKSGWVIVAEKSGLRAWNTKDFAAESRYKEFTEPCLKVALDAGNRVLYTLEAEKIRRWKLKD